MTLFRFESLGSIRISPGRSDDTLVSCEANVRIERYFSIEVREVAEKEKSRRV